jgi:hypothetical protein
MADVALPFPGRTSGVKKAALFATLQGANVKHALHENGNYFLTPDTLD